EVLEKNRVAGKAGNDGFLKKWRHILAIISIAKKLGTYNYSIQQLVGFDLNRIDDKEFDFNWAFIKRYDNSSSQRLKNKAIYDRILIDASIEFSIGEVELFKIAKDF